MKLTMSQAADLRAEIEEAQRSVYIEGGLRHVLAEEFVDRVMEIAQWEQRVQQ